MQKILNERYVLMGKSIPGGMSDVYKAVDLSEDGRTIAVKLFKADDNPDSSEILKESFRRETLALRELKHENIVELLDSGIDKTSGQYFIVMPWIETDLERWLQNKEFDGWDDFYEKMGQPLLQGLAFAHGRSYIHRDLKPKNILITDTGLPKITDFGISKLKSYLEPGVTLAEFASRPYTPQEFDDGSYSYTRDVYSFGVLAVKCLTKAKLKSYEDVVGAFNGKNFDAPDEVLTVISQCLSPRPEDRQLNAGLLLNSLDRIWQSRSGEWNPKRNCYVELSRKALQTIKQYFNVTTDQGAIKSFLEDVNSVAGFKLRKAKDDQPNDPQYDIYGVNISAHATVEKRDKSHLYIFNVFPNSSAQLENQRESAWIPDQNFLFRHAPVLDIQSSKSVLDYILLEIDKKAQETIIGQKQREEERHFWIWERMLALKRDVEKKRNIAISYANRTVHESRVIFDLKMPPPEDIIDQNRQIRLNDDSLVRGVIDDIQGSALSFYVTDGNANSLPPAGLIEFDTRAADVAISRQKEALDAIRFDRSLNPDLKKLLAKPSTTKIPRDLEQVEFITADLDSAKQKAVKKALGLEELLVIEGPPGTGKTTFIAELILQTIRQNPEARILLTSQTHVALDNAVERLTQVDNNLQIVRIASPTTVKSVAVSTTRYLLSNQMTGWKKDALNSGKEFLKSWAQKHNVSTKTLETGTLIKELILLKKRIEIDSSALASLELELDNLDNDQSQSSRELQQEQASELKTEIQSIKKHLGNTTRSLEELQLKLVKLEEDAAEFLTWSTEEIAEWAKEYYFPSTSEDIKLAKLIEIHANWEEQFGSRDEFKVALLSAAQVIAGTCLGIASIKGYQDLSFDLCIVDEASKATPTETLIPLVKSRKWILVGDENQLSPFQAAELQDDQLLDRYELKKSDFRQSLFSHLSRELPAECVSSLTAQHRMVEPIGRLISECFYQGRLEHFGPPADPVLGDIFPKPVTWFSTLRLTDRFEKFVPQSQSFANFAEANVVYELLKRINQKAKQSGKKYKVALIAGYSAQKSEIERRISKDLIYWDSLELQLNTVDAFQGREAEIVIYSVTRSNSEGKIGFLRDFERINVALSRGRFYLGIVGDHYFCQFQSGENPLKKVVDYIGQNQDDCRLSIMN